MILLINDCYVMSLVVIISRMNFVLYPNSYIMFTFSIKREIRKVHVVVVQRPQRNVQKCEMHMQSCCFANLRACLRGSGGPQVGEVTHLSISHFNSITFT